MSSLPTLDLEMPMPPVGEISYTVLEIFRRAGVTAVLDGMDLAEDAPITVYRSAWSIPSSQDQSAAEHPPDHVRYKMIIIDPEEDGLVGIDGRLIPCAVLNRFLLPTVHRLESVHGSDLWYKLLNGLVLLQLFRDGSTGVVPVTETNKTA